MSDSSTREHIRAKLLILVKCKLNQSNCKPNKQGEAIQTVMEGARQICGETIPFFKSSALVVVGEKQPCFDSQLSD
ncbi:MAG: hypothetical protein D084_Lepto4C00259G0001 [Leptospirillum sp. Group IV 'UBA BS']|nr:MAG: hypothetical protein D084_Lepto4C00259G0001 [Leptospirillum sp. Group IV 'UBA BS']